jgi:CheY-like chemotaxis protein
MLNLLSNAAKYTERGFITFTARSRRESGDSITLIFKVSDSGIGIRREDMGRIFTDFSRGGDKRVSVIEGTGLGLSITRQLCRAMGGDVEAESEYGVGSTFTATIRQSATDSFPMGTLGSKIAMRTENGAATFSAPDFRILIVDDNAANLKVAAGLLVPYNMDVHTCQSGEEALAQVQKYEYDLVFMDYMMADMDGIETLAAIRAFGGRFEKLPVVAFTANAMSGMKEFFLEKGFDDYLSKPIELPKLKELSENRVPAEKKRKPEGEMRQVTGEKPEGHRGDTEKAGCQCAMPGVIRAELAVQQLDLLNHYRWHFANDELPTDQAYCEKFSALVEIMDVPPRLSSARASLAAAGRCGDTAEIRRLLLGMYEELAAAIREKETAGLLPEGRGQVSQEAGFISSGEAGDARASFADTLRRLKRALDAGDGQSADATMDELRDMEGLSGEAWELYCFLNDALLMGETEKASEKLSQWV